jgi:hypothetical protein
MQEAVMTDAWLLLPPLGALAIIASLIGSAVWGSLHARRRAERRGRERTGSRDV